MKKFFTFIAVAALAFAAQANVLSVCQGTYYSGSVPVYGLWYDTPGFTQQIYPADMLAEMAGGEITEVSFLTLSNLDGSEYGQDFSSYTVKFYEGQITLALMEVNELGFTEAVAMTGAQVVSTIVPEYGAPALTFVLDEPFAYNGGNLLVEVNVVEPGEYATTYFWGTAMVDENDEDIYTPTLIGNENYSGDLSTSLSSFLCAADFTYTPGQVTPPEPPVVDNVGAPTFEGYTEDGIYGYGVHIYPTTEGSTIMYRVFVDEDGEWVLVTDWTEYEGVDMEIWMTEADAKYRVEAYAYIGEVQSQQVAYEFVVQPYTGINEMNAGKAVAGVRYFNVAGQEMSEANGLTIVVTTYTDGTTSASKVVK